MQGIDKQGIEDLLIGMRLADDARNLREFIEDSNEIEKVKDKAEIPYSVKAFHQIKKITVKSILKVHKQIMSNLDPKIAGQIRDKVVSIGGRTCPAKDLENQLMVLCLFPPLTPVRALDWHVKFEKIHPFFDGNGRTGRLIYYWQCKKLGVKPLTFGKKNLEWYYDLFKE